jgi:hypothetical protein
LIDRGHDDDHDGDPCHPRSNRRSRETEARAQRYGPTQEQLDPRQARFIENAPGSPAECNRPGHDAEEPDEEQE